MNVTLHLFGWQHVSSAGFPTPTSLASATRIWFCRRPPGRFPPGQSPGHRTV